MVNRILFGFFSGSLSLATVIVLGLSAPPYLELIESFYLEWAFILNWVPVILIIIPTILSIYFRSSRLTWYGIFLLLLYGYLAHDLLGFSVISKGSSFPAYRHSLLILPYLIPVQFIVLQYTKTIDLLSLPGLLVFGAFLGEFSGLLMLPILLGDKLVALSSWLNSWPLPIVANPTIPVLPVLLVLTVGVTIWIQRERSYYQHGAIVLFWIVFVTTFSFLQGFEWYLEDGTPFQFILSLSVSGILLNGWTLNYAWSKAYRDKLTQIRGRLALDERVNRLSGQYTIVMIDIDNFKSFNDKFGHDSGDKVLQKVAESLESNASGDVYRFGGEEFTIVYNGYSPEDVREELEELRETVANTKVKVTRKSQRATKILEKRVTISLGMAKPTKDLDTPEKVLNAADEALFKAKDEGRNCLVASGD